MKSFETWLYDDVETSFNIERKYDYQLLTDWLQATNKPNERQKESLDILKINILKNVLAWNEDELKMQFIAPILNVVNLTSDKYKPFSQRSLTLKTDNVETSGLVDFMIATGKSRPKEPFFFLHEYKSQHPSKKNDPLGQLLIAMVAAQLKNERPHPVYGVLVEGSAWYFVILNGKEYAVSNLFDACNESIFQIFAILSKVKNYIEEILAK